MRAAQVARHRQQCKRHQYRRALHRQRDEPAGRGTYTIPALSAIKYQLRLHHAVCRRRVHLRVRRKQRAECGQNNGNGVEYGVYNYNATTNEFTIKSAVVDTNGGCGVWNGRQGRRHFDEDRDRAVDGVDLDLPGGPVRPGRRSRSTTGQIVGSWGNKYQKVFFVFLPAGGINLYSFFAVTQEDTAPTSTGQLAGIEYACGSASALTGGTYTPNFGATCQAPAPSRTGRWIRTAAQGFPTSAARLHSLSLRTRCPRVIPGRGSSRTDPRPFSIGARVAAMRPGHRPVYRHLEDRRRRERVRVGLTRVPSRPASARGFDLRDQETALPSRGRDGGNRTRCGQHE